MGRSREGKICLIKNNVSGDDNVVGGEIKTLITFVVSGVSEENTSGGPGCQFVSGFDGKIRIASTTEHAQVLIGGGDSVGAKYGLVVLIALVGRRFSGYVVVWSPSTQ
jgi:hypothetical protein